MEPEIRYVRSADGTKIAVASAGKGIPLLWHPALFFAGIEHSWALPQSRAGLERLASFRRVIQFDARGRGLSDRGADTLKGIAEPHRLFAVLART